MFLKKFNLKYKILDYNKTINASGHKKNYYSNCRRARDFGCNPKCSSVESMEIEAIKILGRHPN